MASKSNSANGQTEVHYRSTYPARWLLLVWAMSPCTFLCCRVTCICSAMCVSLWIHSQTLSAQLVRIIIVPCTCVKTGNKGLDQGSDMVDLYPLQARPSVYDTELHACNSMLGLDPNAAQDQ